jgi:geranylgeranyl diphosphate synthase type I
VLAERFGAPDLTGDEVVAIQDIFEATGARAEVEATVGRLVEQSLAAAALVPLTDEARQALVRLAHFVAGRDY